MPYRGLVVKTTRSAYVLCFLMLDMNEYNMHKPQDDLSYGGKSRKERTGVYCTKKSRRRPACLQALLAALIPQALIADIDSKVIGTGVISLNGDVVRQSEFDALVDQLNEFEGNCLSIRERLVRGAGFEGA
jgi:hypothetical protein